MSSWLNSVSKQDLSIRRQKLHKFCLSEGIKGDRIMKDKIRKHKKKENNITQINIHLERIEYALFKMYKWIKVLF